MNKLEKKRKENKWLESSCSSSVVVTVSLLICEINITWVNKSIPFIIYCIFTEILYSLTHPPAPSSYQTMPKSQKKQTNNILMDYCTLKMYQQQQLNIITWIQWKNPGWLVFTWIPETKTKKK